MEHESRPWGEFWVLEDTPSHKVKKIRVAPKGRLSYQYHKYRSEVWTIVSGTAIVVLDEVESKYNNGAVVMIPLGAKHRLHNPSDSEDLYVIEVQLGTYFGEDDIIRIEDDYARNSND